MSNLFQVDRNKRGLENGGRRILTLVCAYIVLALAVSVARSELQDADRAQAAASPGAGPHPASPGSR